MKICKIRIKDFKQFKDIKLDFTHPVTGEPLDKICFIGSNGTGKSTLLNFIHDFLIFPELLKPYTLPQIGNLKFNDTKVSYEVIFKIDDSVKYYKVLPKGNNLNGLIFEETEYKNWLKNRNPLYDEVNLKQAIEIINREGNEQFLNILTESKPDLVVYSPSETKENKYIQVEDVPQTTLNASLEMLGNLPVYNEVSSQSVDIFWSVLVALIKERENERADFETFPQNLDKSKRQLIEEFDKDHPKIMDKLGEIWNKILAKANLELDTEGVKNPIQLTDNLKAYIRTKDTKERINYNQLSTGIRNFIFRIGHIYSLYFNREIKRGFLLVDEPENSLYPDFLFDLMEIYDEIVKDKNGENNTQMFFATHNPIVAAQFEPYERIILEWTEDGNVTAHKGTAPVGDDPNDLLEYDFALKNLMGKKGRAKWAEYVDLKKKLIRTKESAEKMALAEQISKIGNDYNFSE